MTLEGRGDNLTVEVREGYVKSWLRRMNPGMSESEIKDRADTFDEKGSVVHNLYADLNRFRLEAFKRIPGVVNK